MATKKQNVVESEDVKEFPPRPVQQVVEVVDEESHDDVEEVSAEAQAPTALPQEVEEEVARNEMVDELFQPQDKPFTPTRTSPVIPEISMHKKRSLVPMITWAAIVLTVAGLTGGGLYMLTRGGGGLPGASTQPTPTPISVVTATPTPIPPARDAITIEVLNGSGEKGVAGTMEELLIEKGYTVESKGNADSYEYEETEIHVKPDKEAYLSLLEEDLQESYTIGLKAADLPDDSDYDVQIIVGQK